MVGFITERDLEQAEESFPGIGLFFDALPQKPETFLELLARFDHWCDDRCRHPREGQSPEAGMRSPRSSVSIAA